MRYLYIFEDGLILQGGIPTDDDLDSVDEGIVTIIQIDETLISEVDSDRTLDTIPFANNSEGYHSL